MGEGQSTSEIGSCPANKKNLMVLKIDITSVNVLSEIQCLPLYPVVEVWWRLGFCEKRLWDERKESLTFDF